MFKKILIANRGEIAVRVICACKELGIKTVAIYSDADRNSAHVRLADEGICIGPPSPSDSYLSIPLIMSAADIAHVDAIHPGYGFLSENANFADICEASGIKFIGPPAGVMRLMGEKERARQAMQSSAVPILPGSDGVIADSAEAAKWARTIGYPVIIKASAGGGGRGMRVIRTEAELDHAFQSAHREAAAAFGNGNLYMEKFIERPRHIEFQILADSYGSVMCLGERECSIQRRHQKLVEESPSPGVTEETRQFIAKKLESCLSSIGYVNAGTVEFLMDEDGQLYFIEMNTRIQVEHTITEMVTGTDLVKAQILIAAGARIRDMIRSLQRRGHSIQCRINAEHPEKFTPSPGRLNTFQLPGGLGVRVETAAHAGALIPPYYDSLIAKLITHGDDREEAIIRMRRALDMFIVDGIYTTIPLHQRIMRDDEFIRGNIDTKYLERLLQPSLDRKETNKENSAMMQPALNGP